MNNLFEIQADLNDNTFLKNNCFEYCEQQRLSSDPAECPTIKGTFRDLCKYLREKPARIKWVKVPQGPDGYWIELNSSEDWEKIRNWWVNAYNLALRQESAELVDSTNWKWWRTKVNKYDEQNIKVEIIDQLHFWISMCWVMGLDYSDAERIYLEKNKVNTQRQETGYIEKDEDDCKHIG